MPSIDDSKCVLVTGATSGIGRALALNISKLPSRPHVVAAGRREERLKDLAKVDGIHPILLDVSAELATLKESVRNIIGLFPDLDTLILNAGIQHEIDLKEESDISKMQQEVAINYTSVVTLISLFLPHFLALSTQGRPVFIVTVTSALGIVPAPRLPNYSATKAALRNFTTGIRAQLKGTNINVIEIIPPLVESELHDASEEKARLSKFWMPLDDFITAAMDGLRRGHSHIPIGTSKDDFEEFETGKDQVLLQRAEL